MTRPAAVILVLVLAAIPAGPVAALSCLPPDVARTYARADAAETVFIVVHGQLVFDESRLPVVDMDHQDATPPETLIPARITGRSLSRAGFVRRFDRAITLEAQCIGPWCAQPVSGTDYLVFLERRDGGLVLSLSPCGGFGFARPDDATLERALRCFRGEGCTPAPFE